MVCRLVGKIFGGGRKRVRPDDSDRPADTTEAVHVQGSAMTPRVGRVSAIIGQHATEPPIEFATALWTTSEVSEWLSRSVNGPYKTAGDVQTNSPGDWDRISTNATNFFANPAGQRFNPSWSGCWNGTLPPNPGVSRGRLIRDAAFHYLLLGGAANLNAIRDELLAQAGVVGTNFSDTSRFCNQKPADENPLRDWYLWVFRLLFAYDIIRNDISAANRDTLDQWFLDAADWINENWVSKHARDVFPNRDSDDYTTGVNWNSNPFRSLYFQGPVSQGAQFAWENNVTGPNAFIAWTGVILDGTSLTGTHTGVTPAGLRSFAERYIHEWLKYSTWSVNMSMDYDRHLDAFPTLGLAYASGVVFDAILVADALARFGDTSLYDFSTTEGRNAAGLDTTGGPKSILGAMLEMVNLNAHIVQRHGTDNAANINDNYLIDMKDEIANEARVHDVPICMGNLYYKNATVKSGYLRTLGASPPYPTSPASNPWEGNSFRLPGSLFMSGQLEGVVKPYP